MLNISQNLKSGNSFYAMATLPAEELSRKSTRAFGFTPFAFCARIARLPFASHEEMQSLLIQPVSPYLTLLSKDHMVLAQPFKVHQHGVNFRGKLSHNKISESQSHA